MKKIIIIIAAVIAAIIIGAVFLLNSVPNKAISLEEQITTAASEIKIQEKRRADLIPNLVDCVKEYDEHEYETLLAVIEARGTPSDATANEVMAMVSALAESYPDLKSSDNYKELMNELSTTENKIATTRSNYNDWVTQYNTFCKKFPNKQILDFLGYEVQTYEKLDYDVSEDAVTDLFE